MAIDATRSARPALQFDGEFLRRLELLDVVARKIFAGLMRADRKSVRKGTSAEFADHRAYVAGDDIRHVDWHLYGRLEEVFLKLYREEENLVLTLLLDASASMDRGRIHKLNWSCEVAAALAYIGMANMDAVNVIPFSGRLISGTYGLRGKASTPRMFDALRAIEPAGVTDMAAAFKEFIARERRRGVVVVLSDFYDLDGFAQALKYLRYPRHDVYAIHVRDVDEGEPDVRGDLRLVDAETGGFREINVTDALLARYREAYEKLARDVESFCMRNEMGYVRGATSIPFDELVLGILRRGGLVR